MKNSKKPSTVGLRTVKKTIAAISDRHRISEDEAAGLVLRFMRRCQKRGSCPGWWERLLDAQFQTHIGPYKRIRCGEETSLSHLIPEEGKQCHDCGCAIGEFHVFGCDSEECSNCHEQAFCCECEDESPNETAA